MLSSAISLLSGIIDQCGFCQRVGDFIDKVSQHMLGKDMLDETHLSQFMPPGSNIPERRMINGLLVILNACASKFSKDARTR